MPGGRLKLKGEQKKTKSSTSVQQTAPEPSGSSSKLGAYRQEPANKVASPPVIVQASGSTSTSGKTAAELKHDEMKKKRLAERAKKEPAKTHKERVAEFNAKLESLTEHHDLPKARLGRLALLTFSRSDLASCLWLTCTPRCSLFIRFYKGPARARPAA